MLDKYHGYALSFGQFFETYDAGVTWELRTTVPFTLSGQLVCPLPGKCWTTSSEGIVHISNGLAPPLT